MKSCLSLHQTLSTVSVVVVAISFDVLAFVPSRHEGGFNKVDEIVAVLVDVRDHQVVVVGVLAAEHVATSRNLREDGVTISILGRKVHLRSDGKPVISMH